MGVDIGGAMIVGALGCDLSVPPDYEDNIYGWTDDHGMDNMPTDYNCLSEDVYFGFIVQDVAIKDIEGEWLDDVKQKALEFKNITGVEATLIGTQSIS